MPRRNLLAIVMVGAVSALCWQTSHGAKPADDMMELYGLFVDAVEQVERNYVRPVDRKELLESALKGMLQDLDPHSTFIGAQDWRQFRRQIEGSFSGIGIQVGMDDEAKRLKVIAPLVGTPAYAAGVLAGDIILEIEGKSTEGMTPDKAVEVLLGRPGTEVNLKVLHEGSKATEAITIRRAIIDVPSVLGDRRKADNSWDFMLDKGRKIGYVRISSFINKTAEELKKALDDLKGQGVRGLILDLRDNPGGLLSAAVEVSDLFITDGKIVSTKGRNTEEKVYEAEEEGTYTGFPMVVLVNEGSASAAEIVSACLQDHDRAVVVGQRSFGKGSVQNILELEDGNSVLKLTVATYWRPSGKNIHRFKDAKDSDEWGVSPSPGLEVKLTPREHLRWALQRRRRDAQSFAELKKAMEEARQKKDEAQEKEKAKDEGKGQGPDIDEANARDVERLAEGPFEDKQLDKAVAILKEKVAGDKSQASLGR